jgi:hypothetical protein
MKNGETLNVAHHQLTQPRSSPGIGPVVGRDAKAAQEEKRRRGRETRPRNRV